MCFPPACGHTTLPCALFALTGCLRKPPVITLADRHQPAPEGPSQMDTEQFPNINKPYSATKSAFLTSGLPVVCREKGTPALKEKKITGKKAALLFGYFSILTFWEMVGGVSHALTCFWN